MAKQAEDIVTAELPLPDVPRRRGRPSTGKAMTPAERQRRCRARKVVEFELLQARAQVYEGHNPGVIIDELAEGLSGDPDDKLRAKAAWVAYGRLMGWVA